MELEMEEMQGCGGRCKIGGEPVVYIEAEEKKHRNQS